MSFAPQIFSTRPFSWMKPPNVHSIQWQCTWTRTVWNGLFVFELSGAKYCSMCAGGVERTIYPYCFLLLLAFIALRQYFCFADASSIWLASYMKVWKIGPELSRLTISRWTHFSRSDKHIFIATVGPKICVKRSEFHFHSEWRDNKK